MKLKLLYTFLSLIFLQISGFGQTQTFNYTGALQNFVVPAGVTSLNVQAWGGGGSSSGNPGLTLNSGGGGGGGAFTAGTLSVTQGEIVGITVGAGGVYGSGPVSGTSSSVKGIVANGGNSGDYVIGTLISFGGAGGTAVTGGSVTASFAGGNGGAGGLFANAGGGGGGGAGGTTGAGGAGGTGVTAAFGGAGGTGGIAGAGGGNGGKGAKVIAPSEDSANGDVPGGGGGAKGYGNSITNKSGGNGQVILTWTCPTYNISSTEVASPICVDSDALVTLKNTTNTNFLPVGTYTVTYDLSDSNVATAKTATMTVTTAGIGTFATAALSIIGNTTIRITKLESLGFCPATIVSSASSTAIITVNPNASIASVSGTSPLCVNSTTTYLANTVVLGGGTGVWSSSNTGIATVNPVTGDVTGITGGISDIIYTITGGCGGSPISKHQSVVVNNLPNTPTLGTITQPTCAIQTGSVVLNNLPTSGLWTLKRDGVIIYSATGGTGSYTDPVLPATGSLDVTYNFTVSVGTCTSNVLPVVIKPIIATTWNGSTWDNGIPNGANSNRKIIFNGNFSASESLEGCSCQVNSGKIVTMEPGVVLNLQDELNVQGTLIFLDTASLVQKSDVINTTNIVYGRNTPALKTYDYVYWSSPIASQQLTTLAANTDLYYSWGGSGWVPESGTMIPGKGYIIRVNTNLASQAGSFTGVPNNGDITYTIPIEAAYALVGNPYPSAISADAFLTANATINGTSGGTLYFWTHNTARFQSGNQLVYSSNDYASYNLTGEVRTALKAASDPNNPEKVPSGKIAAGQAFFIGNNATGVFAFRNTMRSTGSTDNSQFFRQSNTKKSTIVEKSRIWLNLTNEGGAFKQLLVGYIDGATNDFDNLYDGVSYNGNAFVDFYSLNNTKSLTIQGRGLPFDSTDEVPLGYKTTITGTFAIGIDAVDGVLTNQPIYLEDKLTNKIHDLKSGEYSFTTAIGTFKDRFVLRYTTTSKLGTNDFEANVKGVVVSVKNSQIKVNSFDENIVAIKVFDLKGSLIYEKGKVNKNEFIIEHLSSPHQFLIVSVQLGNSKWVSKEIAF